MGQKIKQAVIDKVIALRHNEVRYEDVAEILGIKERTVRSICSKNGCLYADIEDAWKAKVEELRKAGYDYTEVAETLGVDREEVEKYCQYHNLKYQDLGNENRHAYKGGGLNKGKTSVDWDKRVREVLGGRFELVSWILTDNGEARLKVKCTTCGAEKEISSISLRSRQSNRIVSCGICSHLETEQRHKQEREKREFEKNEKQRLREVRKLKKAKQTSFTFCECGKIIPNGTKYCDDCREKHKRISQRQIERRKEHKRRTRIGKTFDRGITLEKLYDRDQGICYLCNRTCDWGDFQKINGAFVVGGSYPTVEHLIPLCKGGTHTWNNIKLACHSCNSKKGRKSYESIAPL